jgi:hypothetical protein
MNQPISHLSSDSMCQCLLHNPKTVDARSGSGAAADIDPPTPLMICEPSAFSITAAMPAA